MEDAEGEICKGDKEEEDKKRSRCESVCAVGAPEPNGVPQGVREAQKASITVTCI